MYSPFTRGLKSDFDDVMSLTLTLPSFNFV